MSHTLGLNDVVAAFSLTRPHAGMALSAPDIDAARALIGRLAGCTLLLAVLLASAIGVGAAALGAPVATTLATGLAGLGVFLAFALGMWVVAGIVAATVS